VAKTESTYCHDDQFYEIEGSALQTRQEQRVNVSCRSVMSPSGLSCCREEPAIAARMGRFVVRSRHDSGYPKYACQHSAPALWCHQ
jgi:hypothetical protein